MSVLNTLTSNTVHAYLDKPIEVALILLLLIEDRRARLAKG